MKDENRLSKKYWWQKCQDPKRHKGLMGVTRPGSAKKRKANRSRLRYVKKDGNKRGNVVMNTG